MTVGVVIALVIVGTIATSKPAHAQTNVSALEQQIQELLKIVAELQQQLIGKRTVATEVISDMELSVGDTVRTTSNLKVRGNPSVHGAVYGYVPAYYTGVILSGPRYADGYTWWYIDYENNRDVGYVGWSAENWIQPVTTSIDSEVVHAPTAQRENVRCSVTSDKSEYYYGEDIRVEWDTDNADTVEFSSRSSQFDLPSGSVGRSGAVRFDADVVGSETIHLTATGESGETEHCSTRLTVIAPSVSLYVNGVDRSTLNVTADADDQYEFRYYPRGDIDSCTVTGYFDKGSFDVTHDWNRRVSNSSEYGRVHFNSVDSRGFLEEVEVVCDTNYRDVSDSIRVYVQDNHEVTDTLRIMLNDQQIVGGSGYTRARAWSRCSQEFNDYDKHNFKGTDVLTCHWGDELLVEIDAWKG